MRKCNVCGHAKALKHFKTKGTTWRSKTCNGCLCKRYKKSRPKEVVEQQRAQRAAAYKLRPYAAVAAACKYVDKRRGHDNDINRHFVKMLIDEGCCYCGEVDGRITLDRINNAVGHLKSNVLPACARCNILRRDMPFEAWMLIAPKIREARELGLFSSWSGKSFG